MALILTLDKSQPWIKAPHECDLLETLILLESMDFEPYLQPATDEAIWCAIRDCLQQAPVSLDEMRTVLITWRSLFSERSNALVTG